MRQRLLIFALLASLGAGCKHQPPTDYRPLDQSGMWFGKLEELKALNLNDAEVAQLARLKQVSASDDLCIQLVSMAHTRQHAFASADAVMNLSRSGFSDQEILEIARTDKLDAVANDAVTLRLIGISNKVVLTVLHRQAQGLPTLSGAAIGDLRNVGLTEFQILERINRGETDAQAEREVAAWKRVRNQTGFVRNRGRIAR
jgi:hypothetical protein